MALSHLLRRRLPGGGAARRLSSAALPSSPSKPPNLSARLSFVFDQIDALDRGRADKDAALQRIRHWRQSQPPPPSPPPPPPPPAAPDVFKREVELVHPWPEWIELLERLAQQNYFDSHRVDEDQVASAAQIDLSGVKDDTGFDFSRDWITVRMACTSFGRDRFDILRSLSRSDIQVLVGHGCPSMDSKVVHSAKLLRKYVRLDEGDVCSSCSLRNSCGKGYILTKKEEEARTLDVMRILLTFGFDHVNGSVENKPLMKMKSVKSVVRKLLHEVVKLGTIPIDPNLRPPVIKKPPPKPKPPPPTPKRRVGRDDVEMKKGDWLCHKCDFMNFAKNFVCLKCDAKRPKRQLLPGEWECPKCNFLNYRRNMACFHCEHKRPPDEYTENQMPSRQSGPHTREQRVVKMGDVSNAWNFDFDDNESDGADVAAFEFADSHNTGLNPSMDSTPHRVIARGLEDDNDGDYEMPRTREGRYPGNLDEKKSNMDSERTSKTHGVRNFSEPDERKSNVQSSRTGFDDFDDEEDDGVDSYEIDTSNSNQVNQVPRRNFSELERTSDSEDVDNDHSTNSNLDRKNSLSDSEDDDPIDHAHLKSSQGVDSRQKVSSRGHPHPRRTASDSDDDIAFNSDSDDGIADGLISRQKNSQSFGGKVKGGDTDSDLEQFLGSDFDDDEDNHLNTRGKSMRQNKDEMVRTVNNSRDLGRHGSDRNKEFRSADRSDGRRSSFGNRGNPSSRGSDRSERGFRSEPRENDRFQSSNSRRDEYGSSRQLGRANQFQNRSRGGHINERGSRNDDYGWGRGDDRLQRNNSRTSPRNERGSRSSGYGGGRGDHGFQRSNSRTSQRNERGSRSDGYGGGRGRGGFQRSKGSDFQQNGRSNRFTDRLRSFDDGDDDRRPRRIIER